jgi:hypothetical protein
MTALARIFTLGAVVVLTSALVVTVSAQASPEVGTWKLNVAKSTYSPGPAPESQTLKYEAAGQGVKVSTEGVNADGSKTATSYTANYDGEDVPITGSASADQVSLKRINATTVERTDKKDGKAVSTITRVMSADGKTLTITTKTTNAQGQAVNNVAVYDKQ